MATYVERAGRVTARIRKAGKSQAKTFATRAEAERWALDIEGALDAHQVRIDVPAVPEEQDYIPQNSIEILEKYMRERTPLKKSWKHETNMIKQMIRDVDWLKYPILAVKKRHVREWNEARLREVTVGAQSRYLDVIRSAFNYAETEWDWVTPHSIVKLVKVQRQQQDKKYRRISAATLQRILFAADQAENFWVRPVIEFALETAMRRSEIANLKWVNVDFDTHKINVVDTKTGKNRLIVMSAEAEAVLRLMLSKREEGQETVFPCTINSLYMCWKRTQKRAGVDTRFHDFRHEACSRFFDRGFSPVEVGMMSGHTTMSQIMRYSHADLDEIERKLRGQ